MTRILRGEIYPADRNTVRGSEQQGGLRPDLIRSHDVFNARSGTVIAVALTSQVQRAGFTLTLEIVTSALPKQSWVKISQILTLSIDRLGQKMAETSPEEMDRIIEGLIEIIG